MKILAIRTKDLTSLDGNTEIDFTQEPLSSADIFAITGPTGAGKSTILDAVCLALYAQTPRYNVKENGIDIIDVKGSTIKQDDVRGILRDGASDGFAEVDFVGIDGMYYRASWRVRRARNKADGNLQAYEMFLDNITTNQSIPGKKTELLDEIERLVGLTFEQFTRSVLLAQGEFTAFLKAGKDEKSSLLEKLTGTNIYSEISKRVFENHREQQTALRELNLKREGILTLTSEELSALLEQKTGLEITIKSFEQELAGLQKEVLWHEQTEKLEASVKSAREQCEAANDNKTAVFPREQALQQIIRVQSVKPFISNLQHTQQQLSAKLQEAAVVIEKIASLQKQKVTLDAEIEKVTNGLAAKTREEEQAQPLLSEARALDIKLSEKEKQVKLGEEEVAASREKQQQHAVKLVQTQSEADLLKQEIEKLEKWKVDNVSRKPIAENESFILSKLQDAGSTLESLLGYTSRIKQAEGKTAIDRKEKERLETERLSVQNQFKQSQHTFDELSEVLAATSIHEIDKKKSDLDSLVENIISAAAHWQLLFQAIKERGDLQQTLESNKKEKKEQTANLALALKELETKRLEKDAYLKSLERARLVATESVEQLRNQLEPGEPCAVCGSIEHPYATHNPVLDKVLAGIEADYKKAEISYVKQLEYHSSLQQSCARLEQDIPVQEAEFTRKNKAIAGLEKTWIAFQVYEKCNEIPVDERTDWLQQQLQEHKSSQKHYHMQIQAYGKQKEELDACKILRDKYEKQLTINDNNGKDIERDLKSLHDQITNDTVEQQKSNGKLDSIKQALSVFFSSEQWFQNWQADRAAFGKSITAFANEWKKNTEKLEENTRQQSGIVEKLKGMQEQSESISEEVESRSQKLSELQLLRNGLTENRKAIFDGVPVETIEATLKNAILSARQVFEKKEQEAKAILEDTTRHVARNEQLEKDKLVLISEGEKWQKELEEWLTSHNQKNNTVLSELELHPLLAFTQEWIENERNQLREIDDAVMLTKSIQKEREQTLNDHTLQRLSEKAFDELKVQQTETGEVLTQQRQDLSQIGFRIKENDTNKQRIGSLLNDIEKKALIVDNWAKLNDVIGSADGKKFRQIAQEYTLDVLLIFANEHLEVLSKRYVLQRIPNSLGLQVIDQDMGDEVRTVHSLSGGESFLVSLALALGLASLSSNRMKVESLFIDEGFGSLDPATLNIAMDALERLHNQGRKVGVISHVLEMTERIPVQITVSKQQSGKSKVEVVGL